jgi:hypothetical protein
VVGEIDGFEVVGEELGLDVVGDVVGCVIVGPVVGDRDGLEVVGEVVGVTDGLEVVGDLVGCVRVGTVLGETLGYEVVGLTDGVEDVGFFVGARDGMDVRPFMKNQIAPLLLSSLGPEDTTSEASEERMTENPCCGEPTYPLPTNFAPSCCQMFSSGK